MEVLDADLCPRYTARVIRNIKVETETTSGVLRVGQPVDKKTWAEQAEGHADEIIEGEFEEVNNAERQGLPDKETQKEETQSS